MISTSRFFINAVAARYKKLPAKQKWLIRIGSAALALTLTVGVIPVMISHAADSAAVSGSDTTSRSDVPAEQPATEQPAAKSPGKTVQKAARSIEPVRASATSGTCGPNATYTLDANGKLTVSGTGAINKEAFYGNEDIRLSIRKVTINSGITAIGEKAFYYCRNITSVSIPDSVTGIGQGAFAECDAMTSITIPGSVTSLPNDIFLNCNRLASVTLPNGLTSIGNSAFYGCSALTSLTIPGNVTSIGNSAFERCSALASLTIPGSVTSIGNKAFNTCTQLQTLTFQSTSLTSGSFTYLNDTTTVSLPQGFAIGGTPVTCSNAAEYFGNATVTNVHTMTKTDAVPATCTEPGHIAYWTCSSCDKLFSDAAGANEITQAQTVVAALDHDWGDWTVTTPATCTESGTETRVCSRDESHSETRPIAALNHDWGDWTVTTPATCTESGTETRVCSRDNSHTETRPIDALGHDWDEGEITQEPTDTEKGIKTYHCQRCGETKTEEIPAKTPSNTSGKPQTNGNSDSAGYAFVSENATFEWNKNSGRSLLFVIKNASDDSATFAKFLDVYVDGERIDSSCYIAKKGSLRLTLKPAYLETLSPGDHTLTVTFSDGSVTHSFRVLAAVTRTSSPRTGEDGLTIAANAVLAVISAMAAACAMRKKRVPLS